MIPNQPPEHPPSPVDILRDKRAMLDTGTGPIAFVVVYAIWGLTTAAIVAIVLGVVMAIVRVVRKKTAVNVLGGLFVTLISALVAKFTGKAETYFVPRALIQAGYAVVFAGSAVVRQPLTGFLVAALFRAEPSWRELPPVKRAMTELTLAWAALFAFRAAIYGVLIATGRVGWLAAGVGGDGLARCSASGCSSAIAGCRSGSRSSARPTRGTPKHPTLLLEPPVDVGPVALQALLAGPGRRADQRRRRHAHLQPVGGQHRQRPLGDPHLPERRRVHVVDHHQVAGAEVAQVEQERAALARRGLDHGVGLGDSRRSRAAEVERERHQQDPVAARRQHVEDRGVIGGERRRVPVRPAHVVDPHVQATDVVAGVRARAAGREGRELLAAYVARQRAVDGVGRERQPEPARHPQRPRLQRHTPLELPAAVGDRVTEGEHAEPRHTLKLTALALPANVAVTRYFEVRLALLPRTVSVLPRALAVSDCDFTRVHTSRPRLRSWRSTFMATLPWRDSFTVTLATFLHFLPFLHLDTLASSDTTTGSGVTVGVAVGVGAGWGPAA